MDQPQLLKAADVARRLAVSIDAVYRLADSGQIPSYKIGRSVRISPTDLQAYLDRQRKPAA